MPALLSVLPGIAVPFISGCLYAVVWYATRGLGATARVVARAAPLAVMVPGICYFAVVLPAEREDAEPPAQATGAPMRPRRTEAAPEERSDRAEAPPPAMRSPAATRPSPGPKAAAKVGDVAPAPGAATGASTSQGDWDVVPVFYGTDRVRQEESGSMVRHATYRPERARRLELGRALVTVPAAHRVPAIERPFALRVPYLQIVLFEQDEDPRKHFTVKELEVLPRDRFLALVSERLRASRAFKDRALVFIHGFNTGFDHALYRTAQLAYDLQFDGAVFLYSWPAGGGVISYALDRESATQAQPYLRDFLALVVKESGAKGVSVIAHSMGNLPLLEVVRELGPALPHGVRLDELVLAAPDVDRDVFANLIAAIRPYGRGITLYCSSNDRAMIAARKVAGGVPRAGDVPDEGPVIIPGIDTIDVTETSTDLFALNHSLYAEKSALLNDIGLLLQTGERPPERRIPILEKVGTARGDFWRYP
jgi:esterase/lipase superfamily enzyme